MLFSIPVYLSQLAFSFLDKSLTNAIKQGSCDHVFLEVGTYMGRRGKMYDDLRGWGKWSHVRIFLGGCGKWYWVELEVVGIII